MLEKNSTILDNAGTDAGNTKSQKISSQDDTGTGSRSKFRDWENWKTLKSVINFQFM